MKTFQIGAGPELGLDVASALDIQACIVDGVDIAPKQAVPDDGDPRILHAVGGFLFTCGPDHIRHPEPVEGRPGTRWPLHGSMAGHPATILSEMRAGSCLEIRASIDIRLADGGQARVDRTWRMNEATGETALEDRMTNSGSSSFVPMWMYHMNIGAHLFGEETMLEGASFDGGRTHWRFGEGDGHVFCVPAKAEPGSSLARVTLGPVPGIGGKRLVVTFDTAGLPHLQMWRNQAAPAHVLGIEPVSHPWKKRAELAGLGLMDRLEPGDYRSYSIGFSFL